jgi:hypothetical protein
VHSPRNQCTSAGMRQCSGMSPEQTPNGSVTAAENMLAQGGPSHDR